MKAGSMQAHRKDDWDVETDLLVIGAGAAGMTAAVVGALEGLKVVLCEKSDVVGGTSAFSAGSVWIPGSSQARTAGTPDTIEAARTYLGALLGSDADDPRLGFYLRMGPRVLDDLAVRTSVQFTAPPVHPDYKALPGAAIGGRALAAVPFDGRKLGRGFDRLRPPRREFTVLGGMMVGKADIEPLLHPFRSWRNFSHAVRLLTRQALDRLRFRRGTRLVMGNALAGRLFHDVRRTGVDVRLDTALQTLIVVGDRVTGAVVRSGEQTLSIRARKGVVLASGGIGWSAELRRRLLPPAAQQFSMAPASNSGDGLLAAEGIGGEIVSDLESPALWMPSSVMRQRDGHLSVFPHILLDRAKPGLLAVDGSGRRFVNEADSYHDFVAAMLRANGNVSRVPSYLVCDRRFIADYGLGLVHPGTRNLKRFIDAGYLNEAGTIEALAQKIGVDAVELRQTIERYNRYAQTGVDEEFGRGASELNRFNGDASNKPNPCLRTIGPGPYYALAVWPSDLASSAGVRTDVHGQVLARAGQLIRGLYAAGNDAVSVFRGTYPGPGTMLGPAIVFGWCAAMDVAGALDRFLTADQPPLNPKIASGAES
jgi:succinate dehydrogenase/fumarate reductase flavoprotein subunit